MALHWLLALSSFLLCVRGLLVPPSFSLDHKPKWLGPGLSLESVLSVISLYELDSHVEVVLLGTQSVDIQSVERRLESMSKISAMSSPLSHVHEKIVYHINSDINLHQKLEDVVIKSSSGANHNSDAKIDTEYSSQAEAEVVVDPQAISKHLEEYFDKATTATTLFVLDLDVHTSSYDSTLSTFIGDGTRHGLRYTYRTASGICRQRTFMSSEKPFAWIDINVRGDDITDGGSDGGGSDLLLPFGMAYNFTSGKEKAAELAGLIHRTGEGMHQFPYALNAPTMQGKKGKVTGTSAYYTHRVQALQLSVIHSFPLAPLDLAVITMCLAGASADGNCMVDSAAKDVLKGLSTTYASASLNIRSDVISIDLATEPQLAHAYYASFEPQKIGNEIATILDTSQFLYWLCMSSLIRELVTNYSSNDGHLPDHEYLPVFVIKGGPSDLLYLNDVGVTTMHSPFPEPPGGWGRASMDKLRPAMRAKDHFPGYHDKVTASKSVVESGLRTQFWPYVLAVVLVSQPNLLKCGPRGGKGGSELRTSGHSAQVRAREELRGAVVEAVWGVRPPYFHYSGASRSAVRDYMWYSPPALRDVSSDFSSEGTQSKTNAETSYFAKRSVNRHVFINKADGILRHLSSLLSTAQSMDYPVDLSYLLDLPREAKERDTEGASDPSGGSSQNKRKSFELAANTGPVSASSSSNVDKFQSDGLFAEFLRFMDRAAGDFSHSDFDLALANLGNALTNVEMMEQRLEEIILARSATVVCNNDQEMGSSESVDPSLGDVEVSEESGLFDWIMLFKCHPCGVMDRKISEECSTQAKKKVHTVEYCNFSVIGIY